jgi:hypothetical protein
LPKLLPTASFGKASAGEVRVEQVSELWVCRPCVHARITFGNRTRGVCVVGAQARVAVGGIRRVCIVSDMVVCVPETFVQPIFNGSTVPTFHGMLELVDHLNPCSEGARPH